MEGEIGERPSAIASPVRLNSSRAVNWSPSVRRMGSNSGFLLRDFVHPFRCRDRGVACRVVGRRATPSGSFLRAESCYRRCEVSLHRHTRVLNCTRICASDRKGETGLDFGGAKLLLLDISVSTYLARGHHSPTFRFLNRWAADPARSPSTSRAYATRRPLS